MSPLDPPHHDIDRTDKLPQLDVAAYEASLASNPTIVRSQLDRTPLRAARPDIDKTIVRDAHSRTESGRDEPARIVAELKADNARLAELRTIADEMVQRLEQKLRDQSVQFTGQLKELQSARFDEHMRGEREREELQQQIAQGATQLAAVQEHHAALAAELRAQTQLANERAESIAELQQRLADEATGAEQLALQLAAKLRDAESLTALAESRQQTIDDLRSQTDRAGGLRPFDGTTAELSTQLVAARRELERIRTEQQSAAQEIIDEQTREIAQLRIDLHSVRGSEAALQNELTTTRSLLDNEQGRRLAVEEQLRGEILNSEGLRAGLDFARTQLQELGAERDSLLASRDEMAEKVAAFDRTEELLTQAQRDIATLHNELGSQAELVRGRDAELAAAHTTLAEVRRERDSLQQDLEQVRQAVGDMQGELRSNVQMLQERADELAAARQEISKHAPALSDLEHSLRARDELCSQLRQQLQTAQDEHAIMSNQLQKVRLRSRSFADQISQRDTQIATLKQELAAHADALAAIRRDVDRIEGVQPSLAKVEAQRVLMPVEHDGDAILLDRPVLTIGRTADNDVCIPSKLISRRHARLLSSANGVVIEDAGSTNGCFVNGIEVTQHLMQDGDVLELGDLRFRLVTPAASTQARDNVIAFSAK